MNVGYTGICLVALGGLLPGCSLVEGDIFRSLESKVGKAEVLSLSPEVNSIVIRNRGDGQHVCIAPNAIGVETSSSSLSASDVIGIDRAGGREASAVGADMVDGMSPNVHVARELMFRLCEFGANANLDKGELIALYKITLSTIQQLPVYPEGQVTVTQPPPTVAE